MINDLSRRSFLGSLLGVVASHNFFARLAHEPVQEVVPICYPYRMLFRDTVSGYTVQAPPIESIIFNEQHGEWRVQAAPMRVYSELRVDQLIILDDSNEVMVRKPFGNGSACLMHGDTLTVAYALKVDRSLPVFTFEDALRLKPK